MKHRQFILSATGRIAAVVTLAFVVAGSAAAEGIVAAGGAGAQPQVSSAANGAAVVNIVAPSASGLSHNQYQDFNVGKPGAVLNNSLSGGQSQLAGQLAANPQLSGQAARVILNEVVSRNPSLLLGKQEVFGQAADYVLANPNGISCNGCGFINTPRASLLVGRTDVEGGAIRSLTSAQNGNALSVGQYGLSGPQVLDLIAPRIDVRGTVSARDAIHAVSGFNRVDYASGSVTTLTAPQGVGALDSYYLGAMQAGRIRILSTAEGAGVNTSGRIAAEQSVDIDARGKLALEATQIHGGRVALAADSVDARARVSSDTQTQSQHDESWFIWKAGETHSSQTTRRDTVERSVIAGGDVSIRARGDATLAATDVNGDKVDIAAGRLTLAGQQSTDSRVDRYDAWKNSWSHNSEKTQTSDSQHGVRINARGDASLAASAGDLSLSGAAIQAGGDVRLAASGKLSAGALVESQGSRDRGSRKNEGASLQTGSWDNGETRETLRQTRIQAGGGVGLSAGGDLTLAAAAVDAGGNLVLGAGGRLDVGTQASASQSQTQNQQTYWGGIGGGGERNNGADASVHTGSTLKAGGKLYATAADGIAVSGSRLKGQQGAYAQAGSGGVVIDSAVDLARTRTDQRDGTVFNITRNAARGQSSQETVQGAQLKSDADLTVVSAGDVAVHGSLVQAAGALGVNAAGKVTVDAKAANASQTLDSSSLDLKFYAKESGDKQYRAGVRIEHNSTHSESQSTTHQGGALSGGSVAVNAGDEVRLAGSKLEATRGDASVSGSKISLDAVHDTQRSLSDSTTTGGGFYYTGGIDKAGSGYEVGQDISKTRSAQSQAQVSSADVAGKLTLNAGGGHGDLSNEGSRLQAGGDVTIAAARVDNRAAQSHSETHSDNTRWNVDIGANVDYSAISRPAEKAVKAVGGGQVVAAGQELGNLGAPNVGIDVAVKASGQSQHDTRTQATVSQIGGASVTVQASDRVTDQGTQYRASEGGVAISAAGHDFQAAADTRRHDESGWRSDADVRVYTTTGKDVNVDAKGKGGYSSATESRSDAVTGSIQAKNGVRLHSGGDASYQGTRIDAGAGALDVAAGGKLAFTQANNTASRSDFSVDGSASVGVHTSPVEGGRKSKGSGSLGVDVARAGQNQRDAQAVNLSAQSGVSLQSGADLTLAGGQIRSQGDVTLKADGRLDLATADSASSKTGGQWGGSVKAGGNGSQEGGKSSKGLTAGASVNLAHTDESLGQQAGTRIQADGRVALSADGSGRDAVHLKGASVQGSDVSIAAANGGAVLESAQNTEHRNNWALKLAADGGGGRSQDSAKPGEVDKTHKASGQIKVDVDQKDSLSQGNTRVQGGQVTLHSDGDLRLAGANVDAGRVTGKVGGDLVVESRKDQSSSTRVAVDLSAGHSNEKTPGLVDQAASVAGPFKDKAAAKGKELVNKAADKVEDKYNGYAFRNGLKEDTTASVRFDARSETVTLPEQPTTGPAASGKLDGAARKGGNWVKDQLLNEQTRGTSVAANVDVRVTRDDAVATPSGIAAQGDVALTVGGKVQLGGATLQSQQGRVDLGDARVETQAVSGSRYTGGGGVKASGSVADVAQQAIADIGAGRAPLIRAEHKSETQTLEGGIVQGK